MSRSHLEKSSIYLKIKNLKLKVSSILAVWCICWHCCISLKKCYYRRQIMIECWIVILSIFIIYYLLSIITIYYQLLLPIIYCLLLLYIMYYYYLLLLLSIIYYYLKETIMYLKVYLMCNLNCLVLFNVFFMVSEKANKNYTYIFMNFCPENLRIDKKADRYIKIFLIISFIHIPCIFL